MQHMTKGSKDIQHLSMLHTRGPRALVTLRGRQIDLNQMYKHNALNLNSACSKALDTHIRGLMHVMATRPTIHR
eukprot:scaffold56080_cov37-Prasinocladus_malaysianus.AAC.2